MPGNTYEYAMTPDGLTALHAGTWHWLEDDERNGSYDLNDSSVSTSWETCDLSGRVPPGTVAIFGMLVIATSDADDVGILLTRPFGSAQTDIERLMSLVAKGEQGANYTGAGCPCYILAPNGKFQYSEHSTLTIDYVTFELWGYMI